PASSSRPAGESAVRLRRPPTTGMFPAAARARWPSVGPVETGSAIESQSAPTGSATDAHASLSAGSAIAAHESLATGAHHPAIGRPDKCAGRELGSLLRRAARHGLRVSAVRRAATAGNNRGSPAGFRILVFPGPCVEYPPVAERPEPAGLRALGFRSRLPVAGLRSGLDIFSLGELVHGFALDRSEEHTSELQSRENLVCRLLLEKKNTRGVFL